LIQAPGTAREKRRFLRDLVFLLRDSSIEQAALDPAVTVRVAAYVKHEEWMRKIIRQVSSFLPQDENHEVIILDLTGFRRREKIIKNLALLDYPQALAVLEIQPLYQYGVRSTELSVSMSLSLNMNGIEHGKDVGEIMRRLNLGDGHAGAGAGLLQSSSKSEMLKKKQEVLNQIFEIWRSQPMQKSIQATK
jgi:hypothetical protein